MTDETPDSVYDMCRGLSPGSTLTLDQYYDLRLDLHRLLLISAPSLNVNRLGCIFKVFSPRTLLPLIGFSSFFVCNYLYFLL